MSPRVDRFGPEWTLSAGMGSGELGDHNSQVVAYYAPGLVPMLSAITAVAAKAHPGTLQWRSSHDIGWNQMGAISTRAVRTR